MIEESSSKKLERPNNDPNRMQKRYYKKFLKRTVVIYLMSGVKVVGLLKEFDDYSIAVLVKKEEVMIYKHAISLIKIFNPAGKEKSIKNTEQ